MQGWMVSIWRKSKKTHLFRIDYDVHSSVSLNIMFPLLAMKFPSHCLSVKSYVPFKTKLRHHHLLQIVFKMSLLTPMTLDSYLPHWLLAWPRSLLGQWGNSKCDTSKEFKSDYTLKLPFSLFLELSNKKPRVACYMLETGEPTASVAPATHHICEWGCRAGCQLPLPT